MLELFFNDSLLRAKKLLQVFAFEAEEAAPKKYEFKFIPQFFTKFKLGAYKRAESFEKDYTALLLSLASAVRTGLDPIVALLQSEKLFTPNSELERQLRALRIKIEEGVDEEQAILSFAQDIQHPDIRLFRTAFLLARKEGSSLGGCLQRLARVTRQRQSFRRKIRSSLAMQRLSAIGIALCTIVIGLVQWVSNPRGMADAFAHPAGWKVMSVGLALVIGGVFWMLNLSRSRI